MHRGRHLGITTTRYYRSAVCVVSFKQAATRSRTAPVVQIVQHVFLGRRCFECGVSRLEILISAPDHRPW